MLGNDDIDWPVHTLMLSFQNLCGLMMMLMIHCSCTTIFGSASLHPVSLLVILHQTVTELIDPASWTRFKHGHAVFNYILQPTGSN